MSIVFCIQSLQGSVGIPFAGQICTGCENIFPDCNVKSNKKDLFFERFLLNFHNSLDENA